MIWSDTQIREAALGPGRMIEPFEEGLVRPGVISYGLSGYGYDIRVGRNFKVFSNVHCTVIDPKNFDPLSFVDIEGDFCLIPPNSFALAQSVEKFNIPRNVLCVVLGKSTYARCFTGDTLVALVDGTSVSLADMAVREAAGEMFWGYSIGPSGDVVVANLEAARQIGTERILAVELDSGESIRCTPDHKFVTRSGEWKAAEWLSAGDSLMPLYRTSARGYEAVYQPTRGHLSLTHRLADDWNLRNGIYQDEPGTDRHHKDHVKTNNNPWNIERMEESAHARHHNKDTYGEDFDPAEHGAAIKEALARLSQDAEWVKRYRQAQSDRATAFWHLPEYAEARIALMTKKAQCSSETRQRMKAAASIRWAKAGERKEHGQIMREAWRGDEERRKRQSALLTRLSTKHHLTDDVVLDALRQTGSIRGAARLLGCDRSVFRRYSKALEAFRSGQTMNNHRVISVSEVSGVHDVYCLSVPETGNFALEAGVFVSNCGIVLNTTPLEPSWKGKITLEISNTTPLPAKIYANEGIGQVLFFEGVPCERSYADKRGVYQDQTDVTLPRVRR